MPDSTPEKLDLASMDIAADKRRQLQQLFPEAFTETGGDGPAIDFEKLKAVLGEHAELAAAGQERYGLEWPGKRDALKAVQAPSQATLIPAPEESVDWESTKNVFIEGDNLEVLKLLQKSYYGKVKMIYIDPPYNTGNDFVYPDNYTESLDTYLRYTGQVDDQGFKTTTNSKDSGRFHSNWLRMMYPRLYVAKNLLREDGVILISIDQNEEANLRLMLEQLFGGENYLGTVSVLSNPRGRQSEKIATCHESVIIFSKSQEQCELIGEALSEEEVSDYRYSDDEERPYRLLGLRHRGNSSFREDRPLMFYPLYVNPENCSVSVEKGNGYTIEVLPRKSTGEDGRWEWGKATAKDRIRLLEAVQVGQDSHWDVCHRDFLYDEEGKRHSKKWKSIWGEKSINYQNGKKELKSLFDGKLHLEYPKPLTLLKKIIQGTTGGSDLILDFFAGSGTTLHASFFGGLNDGNQRKVILVQLPEVIENPQFRTIADITKERIRRAGAKIRAEWETKETARKAAEAKSGEAKAGDLFSDKKFVDPSSTIPEPPSLPPDTGFRVFKLAPSNFKRWDGAAAAVSKGALVEQLEANLDHIAAGATEESLLFEILLKAGYELTCPLEKLELAGRRVWSVDGAALFICVEDRIDSALVDAVAALHPVQFICLDRALQGNDPLKVNTLETFRSAQPEIQFRTV